MLLAYQVLAIGSKVIWLRYQKGLKEASQLLQGQSFKQGLRDAFAVLELDEFCMNASFIAVAAIACAMQGRQYVRSTSLGKLRRTACSVK